MKRRELIQPVSTRPPPRHSEIRKYKPESSTEELESEEMREVYRAIYERSHEAIFICDLGGNFLNANDATLSLLGMSIEELRAKKITELLPLSQIPLAVSSLKEIMTSGAESEIRRFNILSADGRDIVVAARASLALKEGKPHAIVGIARDVTDFMRMQDELRKASSLAAIGEASGKIGHDLRNLLAPAIALVSYLRQVDPQKLTPENVATLQRIASSADEAMTMGKRLIEEMLLLSAPGPKVFDNVDVNPLLGVILERVSNALEDREPDYSFVTDFCGMPLITRGDRVQLDRALSNIILNAVEAMPQGGEIRIKTEKHNANGESFVKVTIADEGPGMEQEVLEKIFTPHFSTKGERGTGLGLAITAKAISDHAGGISVASEPGKGAVFEVLLPAK